MGILSLFIMIIVIGLACWLVNTYIPMPANIKSLLNVVAVIVIVVILLMWLLSLAGGPYLRF